MFKSDLVAVQSLGQVFLLKALHMHLVRVLELAQLGRFHRLEGKRDFVVRRLHHKHGNDELKELLGRKHLLLGLKLVLLNHLDVQKVIDQA